MYIYICIYIYINIYIYNLYNIYIYNLYNIYIYKSIYLHIYHKRSEKHLSFLADWEIEQTSVGFSTIGNAQVSFDL